MKLILFDIDGTLLHTNGLSKHILLEALQAVYAQPVTLNGYQFGGKTDQQIVSEIMTAAGLAEGVVSAGLGRVYAAMGEMWLPHIPSSQITLCPGIQALLAALAQERGVVLGLLTGNARHTAVPKVRAGGLDASLFRVGAFGDEAADRNALPPLALARARELFGREVSGRDTIIIGDTPADIACARAVGAKAIAVATGFSSKEKLATYAPDLLFEDLANTAAVLERLLY